MKRGISTLRFGNCEIDECHVLTFPDGLFGFPELTEFVVWWDSKTGDTWLQSTQDPVMAFLVGVLRENVLVVLTRNMAGKVTACTKAPLFIDYGTKTGKQLLQPTGSTREVWVWN
jgi:flagellar assembly factor FliW